MSFVLIIFLFQHFCNFYILFFFGGHLLCLASYKKGWTPLFFTMFSYIKREGRTDGRLAHLARHAPLNARVNYAVGSSPTGSITKQFMKQFQSVKMLYIPRQSTSVN